MGNERRGRSRARLRRAPWAALLALAALGACDYDSDGPAEPCGEVDCGAHGQCVSDGVTPYCACDDGFRHDGLTCVAIDAGQPARDAGLDAAIDAATDAAADAAPPPPEVCNGDDDDADGTVDEGCWTATGPMTVDRRNHSATLLADGRVLVAGGRSADGTVLASAEIYDPADGSWHAVGSMTIARHVHQAVRLADGRVLVAGGFGYQAPGWYRHDWASTSAAELFDPDTETWSLTDALEDARYGNLLAPLPDGRVLAAGGFEDFEYPDGYPDGGPPGLVDGGLEPVAPDGDWHLDSAESYDPLTGRWSQTTPMPVERHAGFGGLLGNGEVLFAGGQSSLEWLPSAVLYDPIDGTWAETGSMPATRGIQDGHPMGALLADGRFLMAGAGGGGAVPTSAVLFDPATSSWRETGPMAQPRVDCTLSPLTDGRVLAAGGSPQDLASTELYDPSTGAWSPGSPLAVGRAAHTATVLRDGRVLACGGGGDAGASLDSCELYTPDPAGICRWSAPCGDLVCDPTEVCAACLSDCACPSGCGNGSRQDAEECDDGNQFDGDLCSNACVARALPLNTTVDGDQFGPRLALTPGGTLVAAFVDGRAAVRVRRFDARGVALDEADAEVISALDTAELEGLTPTDGGGFLAVFGDRGAWPREVRGRRFDACGTAEPVSDLLATAALPDVLPSGTAIALPSGEVLLVWASSQPESADESGQAIFQRRLDASGAPVDPDPILVNTTFAGDQIQPAAAALDDGAWVVLWRTYSNDEIRLRQFGPDGTPAGDDVAVATGLEAKVAAIPGTGFVILWGSLGCPGGVGQPAEVLFQRFDLAGAPLGEPQQANTTTDGRQGPRAVAANGHGDFLVLFDDGQGCCGGCGDLPLRGRFFDSAGLPLGEEIAVADFSASSAVALPDGSFAVAYETGEHDDRDIGLQRLPTP